MPNRDVSITDLSPASKVTSPRLVFRSVVSQSIFAWRVGVNEMGDVSMPMGRPKAELVLSEDERSQLMSIAFLGLSVISWARHIVRCKSHGYADEEEKANGGASSCGPRGAA